MTPAEITHSVNTVTALKTSINNLLPYLDTAYYTGQINAVTRILDGMVQDLTDEDDG